MDGPTQVLANFNYIKRNNLYKTVKPYRLQYEPEEGLDRTNIEIDFRRDVPIRNLRCESNPGSFEKTGFQIGHLDSTLSENDFYHPPTVEAVYHPEIEKLLMKEFQPDIVKIMEHQVRKRHQDHPISKGEDYEWFQPTTIVHSDYTMESANEVIREILGMNSYSYKRIIAVNVWKPLHGPVTDWPVALCDASSARVDSDFQPCDIVSRKGYTENCRIYHNDKFRWYFLRGQLPTEVLIFRQYDTDTTFIPVPHTGFADASWEVVTRPRESIEVRAFMFWE